MPRIEDHLLVQERIRNKWDHEWDGKLKAHLQRVADMSWNVRGGMYVVGYRLRLSRSVFRGTRGDFLKLKSRPTVHRYACACNPARTLRGEKYNHIRYV